MLQNHGNVLDLHDHTEDSAILAVCRWFAEMVTKKLDSRPRSKSFEIITGWGKWRKVWQPPNVRAAVRDLLVGCEIACNIRARNPAGWMLMSAGFSPDACGRSSLHRRTNRLCTLT